MGIFAGERNPFYGKTTSDENKLKTSIRCKNKPNWGVANNLSPFYIDDVIYYTLNHAAKKLNIISGTIRHRLLSENIKHKIYKLSIYY